MFRLILPICAFSAWSDTLSTGLAPVWYSKFIGASQADCEISMREWVMGEPSDAHRQQLRCLWAGVWDSFYLKFSGSCQASSLCSLGSLFVMVSRKSILPTNVVTFNFFFRIFQDAHWLFLSAWKALMPPGAFRLHLPIADCCSQFVPDLRVNFE